MHDTCITDAKPILDVLALIRVVVRSHLRHAEVNKTQKSAIRKAPHPQFVDRALIPTGKRDIHHRVSEQSHGDGTAQVIGTRMDLGRGQLCLLSCLHHLRGNVYIGMSVCIALGIQISKFPFGQPGRCPAACLPMSLLQNRQRLHVHLVSPTESWGCPFRHLPPYPRLACLGLAPAVPRRASSSGACASAAQACKANGFPNSTLYTQ